MKRYIGHHHFTREFSLQEDGSWKRNVGSQRGGRVASRKLLRPVKRIVSKVESAGDAPMTFFFPNIRRTRLHGQGA